MRRLAAALAAALALIGAAAAQNGIVVESRPVETFQGRPVGSPVGNGLIWRGGLVFQSTAADFGGLSAIGLTSPDGRVVLVSDRGNFITGRLTHDAQGRPVSLTEVRVTPIVNSSGARLPTISSRDAEAMAVIMRNGRAAAIRVGFEGLTRVADFTLIDGIPTGPAREVAIPDWLGDTRTNQSLESVCIAPPASPIAGSTLLIAENVPNRQGHHSAYLLGVRDRGALSLGARSGVNPTDCAFLPNGDLLVLERGVVLIAFSMVLRRIPAAQVKPGAVMEGEVLLSVAGGDIDNMEGIAVYVAPDGETRIVIIADNNFNGWERNLLLEFGLAN